MKNNLLLFEDRPEYRVKIAAAINKLLKGNKKLVVFNDAREKDSVKKTYENYIFERLGKYKNLSLIICDRDLSRLPDHQGLSGNAVCDAASRLGIPVCLYAANIKRDDI